MSEYRVGKVDFTSLMASFTSVLNYETDSYRQLADYNIAVARMENLTGEAITTDPTAADQEPPAVEERGVR